MIRLNKIEKFQLFCLENYRISENMPGKKAWYDFERKGVFDFLAEGYEVLHTQGIRYIVGEINVFLERRK
jgi:hypothetical protein